MKFQKIIRGQMVLMGLAGALLLANSACAQQEVDPTFFDATPGAPQANQAAVVPVGQSLEARNATESDAAATLAVQEVTAAPWTPLDENGMIFLVVAIGSVVLLGMAEAVRGTRRRAIEDKAMNGFPSGATAN